MSDTTARVYVGRRGGVWANQISPFDRGAARCDVGIRVSNSMIHVHSGYHSTSMLPISSRAVASSCNSVAGLCIISLSNIEQINRGQHGTAY